MHSNFLSDNSGQLVEEYWKGGALRENAVPVTTSLSSARQAMLEAKSALLASKWSSHPEWPLVTFDFSSELDEPFWKYLKNVWPQQQMNALALARISFPDGSVYVGGYQLQDHVLKKSGRGRLTTRSYTLDGIFANDELAGNGKIQMPGSATWHVVTLQNSSPQVDSRPASAPGAASQ